jgi:hypothetical protein
MWTAPQSLNVHDGRTQFGAPKSPRVFSWLFESWSSATSVNTGICPVDRPCTLTQAVGLRTTAEKCRPLGSRLASILLAAGVQASARHPFAQATFYQEGFF